MNQDQLDALFLGPKSENRRFLKEIIELILDDYIFWRRNYHPKDPHFIKAYAESKPEVIAEREQLIEQLFLLIADLKLDVPFFSPRYMAHMVPEVSLPGILAYLATFLYNPNNVSGEASTVSVAHELEVGSQFAELFGYDTEKAFGHLTSGGTIANYESIWFNRAGRLLGLSMAICAKRHRLGNLNGLPTDVWELLNLSHEATETYLKRFSVECFKYDLDPWQLLKEHSIHSHGERGFSLLVKEVLGDDYNPPVIMIPETAHYSWKRAAQVFGIGRKQLMPLPVDEDFHIDIDGLRSQLDVCRKERIPVLQLVCIPGTTEFGSIDPVDRIVAVRDEYSDQGLYMPIHADAAFGGYFASLFKSPAGTFGENYDEIFAPELVSAFRALAECDSITVDPHKMGYAPYGAGSIVMKHGYLRHLVQEQAPYCLDHVQGRKEASQLGRYIMEGSKPGAAASAVWFIHKMLPLNQDGFGAQLLPLCKTARRFYHKIDAFNRKHADDPLRLMAVNKPETNIVCLSATALGFDSIGQVNALNHKLYQRFSVCETDSIESYDYLVSHTVIDQANRIMASHPELAQLDKDQSQLELLRLVFMNRWVDGKTANGVDYLDDFLEALWKAGMSILAEMNLSSTGEGESRPLPHPVSLH